MAENTLETPSFGNFGIENTMEMGMGNQELLSDLLSPETSTASPDDIEDIKEEAPAKQKAAAAPPKKEEEKKEEKEDPSKAIQDFFQKGGEDDDEEEEEEKPVSKKKTPESPKEETEKEEEEEQSPSTQFSALAKDLTKLGVFTTGEDEEEVDIKTPEQFLERFQNEKKKGAIEIVNNFIGQFGEDYQNAFEAIYVKGVNPKDYFSVYNKIENFSEMDLSQEANQVAVLKQALADQGFESEDIDTEIERLKNYGDLESVATKHHKVLVKKEAAKLSQLEQEKEQQLKAQAAYRQQYINNVQTILQEKLKTKEYDGIPINPKLAGELQDFLLVDKYQTSSGEKLTDFDKAILELKRPENHALKVKYALLLKILEKDPTLSTIQKTGITKKSNELFSEVARQTEKTSRKSTTVKPTSWFQ
jgi:hypothetical protein